MKPNTLYQSAHQSGRPLLVWGKPGCGKTASIRAYAKSRGIHVEELIAAIREPSDFLGLPQVIEGQTRFCPPDWAVRLAEKPGILFLDELSTAPPAVQAALLRVALERHVGDLALHEKTWVVAAANPTECSAGGFELAAPLANRFLHVEFPLDAADWTEQFPSYWGKPPASDTSEYRNARAAIASFIRRRPDLLHALPEDPEQRQRAWPSPRSWDYGAQILASIGSYRSAEASELLAAAVGATAAAECCVYLRDLDLPAPEEILQAGSQWRRLKRLDQDWAALSAMVAYVLSNPSKQNWEAAWNVLVAVSKQSGADVAIVAARTLKRLAEEELAKNPKNRQYVIPSPAISEFSEVLSKIS